MINAHKFKQKVKELAETVAVSKYWADEDLRTRVLTACIPQTLSETFGFENIVKKLPEVFLKTLFANSIAIHYGFKEGSKATAANLLQYLENNK